MINIIDQNAADKVIALERQLGWPEDCVGKQWEKDVRKHIDKLREALKRQIELATVCPGEIYGQGGFDRYAIMDSGEIVFLKDLCTHMDKEKASQAAESLGFSVL